jgi:DNA-binding transcriptional regulator/RsmH inhibitor MraZ
MIPDGNIYLIPLGTYRRTIDAESRIIVPGIWREEPLFKNDSGYLSFRRPCRLVLLPQDFVNKILKGKRKGIGVREKEDIRILLAALHTVMLDRRGRMTVPEVLAGILGIGPGDVMTLTATGGWVEIWPADEWERSRGEKGLFTP